MFFLLTRTVPVISHYWYLWWVLLLGTTQRIPAHKYVLAVGSSVFYAMFYGGLKSEEEIQVPDVEPAAFLTLLRLVILYKH